MQIYIHSWPCPKWLTYIFNHSKFYDWAEFFKGKGLVLEWELYFICNRNLKSYYTFTCLLKNDLIPSLDMRDIHHDCSSFLQI